MKNKIENNVEINQINNWKDGILSKVMYSSMLVIVLLFLFSCRRDYICRCLIQYDGGEIAYYTDIKTTSLNTKWKYANKSCSELPLGSCIAVEK